MTPATAVAFVEAFLTVEVAGLTAVMVQGQAYAWPAAPALAIITAGAVLAGVRRVQALLTPPPPPKA